MDFLIIITLLASFFHIFNTEPFQGMFLNLNNKPIFAPLFTKKKSFRYTKLTNKHLIK